MVRILSILLLSLLTAICSDPRPFTFSDQAFLQAALPTGLPQPDLLYEDFEIGSKPTGWGESGSTVWNYTPAILGNYSMTPAVGGYANKNTSSSCSNSYTYMQIVITNNYPVALSQMCYVRARAYITTTGQLRMFNAVGDKQAVTTGVMATNTTYHIWIHYKTGASADAVITGAFSTTAIEPTTGTNFTSVSGVTDVSPTASIFCYPANVIFDHIGIASFPMPNGW